MVAKIVAKSPIFKIAKKVGKTHPKRVVFPTFLWRRRRDSNPRYDFVVYTISNYGYWANILTKQHLVCYWLLLAFAPQYLVAPTKSNFYGVHDWQIKRVAKTLSSLPKEKTKKFGIFGFTENIKNSIIALYLKYTISIPL